MKQWNLLSSELINGILINLQDDKKSLLSCQLVCKNWYDPAQRLFYKKIVITNPEQFLRLSQAISTFSHLFHSTQEIKFDFDLTIIQWKSTYLTDLKQGFPVILEHCPNLKTISMDKMAVENPLYQAIIDHQGEKLRLENLPFPSTYEPEVINYGEAVWSLRDTAKTVFLANHGKVTMPYFDRKNISKLDMFSHLKNVEYYLAETVNPSLPKALYSIGDQDTINDVSIALYYYHGHIPSKVYEKTKVYKNVKTLSLLYAICSDSLVDYIVHTFANLEKCTMKFSDFDFQREDLEVTSNTCIKFLNQLNKIKQFDIKNLPVYNLIDAINSYLPSIIKKCELKISYGRDEGDRLFTSFTNTHFFHAIFSNFPKQYDSMLPHQTLIDKFGPDIQHLIVRIPEPVFHSYKHRHMNGHIIQYVLENCPSLQTLCLESTEIKYQQQSIINSISLKKITLHDCHMEKTVLPQLSAQLPQLQVFYWKGSHCPYDRCHQGIDMEDTAFENLVFESIHKQSDLSYYIRLYIKSLDVTQLYYLPNGSKEAEQLFEEPPFLQDPIERLVKYALLIDIRCKSLQTLGLRMYGFNGVVSDIETKPYITCSDNENIVDKLLSL